MLTLDRFDILRYLMEPGSGTAQRDIAEHLGISLGKVNGLIKGLRQDGLIDTFQQVTAEGLQALEPYKVTNAIIMAAGLSSRFVPLSYERPKALLKVKGEVMIERQIKQLQDAGIHDITLVVGYLKEQLFYLGEKFGVDIVVNEDYYKFNNTSTLLKVIDRLDNTYICSSDDYFTEDPFEPYVYRSYYAAVYEVGDTEEYCLQCDKNGRIIGVTIGGKDAWCMLGHVYFDRDFSQRFAQILQTEFANPLTQQEVWENLYMRHLDELEMYIRKYDRSVIQEFDNIEDLRFFDEKYLTNADSHIFTNICQVLGIAENEIMNIVPLKKGLTDLSFCFTARGQKYVYRHPGFGTSAYIDRASEKRSMDVAKALGLDETFIYMDATEGWKISHYIEDAVLLDHHDEGQVIQAMGMLRTLHDAGYDTGRLYDVWDGILSFEEKLKNVGRDQFEDLEELHQMIAQLHDRAKASGEAPCLCHCDAYGSNFLLDTTGKLYLIDWEYSAMTDRGFDIGTYIACSDYTLEEAQHVIEIYLGHPASLEELYHYFSYVAMVSYHRYLWAIYQDSNGKTVGESLYIWYKYTKQYSQRSNELYEELIS